MLLSARMLSGVADVNHFDVVTTLEMTAGDQQDIYFQLIDASVEKFSSPRGRRYVPAAGASLRVTLQDLNSDQTLTGLATQPFSGDLSVWKFKWPLPPFSNISYDPAKTKGTYALKLVLTEPGSTMPTDWDGGTTYAANATVSYGGAAWRSLNAGNLGHTPSESIWWTLMTINPTKTFTAFVSQAVNIVATNPEF